MSQSLDAPGRLRGYDLARMITLAFGSFAILLTAMALAPSPGRRSARKASNPLEAFTAQPSGLAVDRLPATARNA